MELWGLGWVVDPVGAPCMGGVQDNGACSPDGLGLPVCTTFDVNSPRHWRTSIEAIRVEERGTEPTGVPEGGDRLEKRRAVLHGPEQGQAVGVVVKLHYLAKHEAAPRPPVIAHA